MKRIVSMIIASAICFGISVSAKGAFADVSEDEIYSDAIDHVYLAGLMSGYGDGNFRPERPVSRAEMASIVCKLLGVGEGLTCDSVVFKDVPVSHWANGVIAKAVDLGFVSGYGNGTFGPDDTVTYEQALTMILNAFGLNATAGELGGYPDGYIRLACDYNLNYSLAAEKGDALLRWQVAVILRNASF